MIARCILCAREAEGALLCGTCDAVFHEVCRARDAGCPACGATDTPLRHVPKKRIGITRRALLVAPFVAGGGALIWHWSAERRGLAMLGEALQLEREARFSAALAKLEPALGLVRGDALARVQHARGRLLTTLGDYRAAADAFDAMPLVHASPAALDDHGVLKRLRFDVRGALELHNKALMHARATPATRLWSYVRIAEADHLAGALHQAVAAITQATEVLRTARPDALLHAHVSDLHGRILEDLSGMYVAQSKYMAGLVTVDTELRTQGRFLPAERRASLEMLAGWFLHARGQYPEARERYLRALLLRRKNERDRRLPVAATLARLAWIDRNLGAVGPARQKLDEAMELRTAAFHASHPMVGETLEQIVALGDSDESRRLAKRAQAIREAIPATAAWRPVEEGVKPFQRMIAYSPLTLWRV